MNEERQNTQTEIWRKGMIIFTDIQKALVWWRDNCVPTSPFHFGDKFVPKSKLNLTKPPFGDDLNSIKIK